MMSMATLRAKVMQGGRVEVVDRVDLPEGTELELDVIGPKDELDDMTEAEREALHASIERGLADMRAGRGRSAEEFLAELRQRR